MPCERQHAQPRQHSAAVADAAATQLLDEYTADFDDDGGETFGPASSDARLADPICQGSIVTFGGATYFSNSASKWLRTPMNRRIMLVRYARSWASWLDPRTIFPTTPRKLFSPSTWGRG